MSNLLILGSTSGAVRTEKRDGKSYTVVPIVALVEGVIHAMNAKGPELVRTNTFSPTPPLWNGRPVFLGHPLNEQGRPVSGAIPHVAKRSIGMVYNCGVKDEKLCMEAWLDERAPKELLDRVNAGDPVEVSVGVFVDTDETTGNHGGRDYQGEWHNMVPDHLAILPAGDIGACSWAAGCGVRAASLRSAEIMGAIGNGNNQYTHGGGDTHYVAEKGQTRGMTSHGSKEEAQKVATDRAKKTGEVHQVYGPSSGPAVSTHYPDGRVTRNAIGNGNNQYTHGQAAAAHEKAATAHDDAAALHQVAASSDSASYKAKANDASQAAEKQSDKTLTKSQHASMPDKPHEAFDAHRKSIDAAVASKAGDHVAAMKAHKQAANYHRDAAADHKAENNVSRVSYPGKPGTKHGRPGPRNSQEGSTDEMVEKKGLTTRIFETLREVFRTNDTSDSEVRSDLNEMLREQGTNGDVVDVYDGYFVYCLYAPDGMSYYRRDYTKDATGAVASVGTDVTEVEPKRSYEPVAASTTQPEPTAACGCHQQKEKDLMDLKTRVKALITASKGVYEDTDATMLEGYKPERLTALEAKFAEAVPAAKTVETSAAAVAPAAVVPVVPAKEPTFDELLAKADPDTRAAIESGRNAAAAKKTATIATLKASKRCDYSDEQLTAMSQVDLDRLAKLASVTVATGAVDYSGQGAPRVGGERQGAPAPIELKDALAANKK